VTAFIKSKYPDAYKCMAPCNVAAKTKADLDKCEVTCKDQLSKITPADFATMIQMAMPVMPDAGAALAAAFDASAALAAAADAAAAAMALAADAGAAAAAAADAGAAPAANTDSDNDSDGGDDSGKTE